MAVLIKNGTIVTAEGERKADIYAEGESMCTFPSPTRAARPVDSKHPMLLLLAVRQLLLSS